MEEKSLEAWSLELRAAIVDLRLYLALRRFGRVVDEMVRKYRPDQPRTPQGVPEGGEWTIDLGSARQRRLAAERIRVAQIGPAIPIITPETMTHIINSHGFYTPRTSPRNSRFFAQYSTPAAIQDMANELYRQRIVPKPWKSGNLYQYSGVINDVDLETGAITPVFVGTDGDGNLSNRVLILFNPITGLVETMYNIPME
ncbi:hypothetical protein [uncultured Devosia sp.]|uniref:hypothetical protein n=1 Tax=uncultured Devosia sp. TaxID=211434 RepID=UPI0035CC0BDC